MTVLKVIAVLRRSVPADTSANVGTGEASTPKRVCLCSSCGILAYVRHYHTGKSDCVLHLDNGRHT